MHVHAATPEHRGNQIFSVRSSDHHPIDIVVEVIGQYIDEIARVRTVAPAELSRLLQHIVDDTATAFEVVRATPERNADRSAVLIVKFAGVSVASLHGEGERTDKAANLGIIGKTLPEMRDDRRLSRRRRGDGEASKKGGQSKQATRPAHSHPCPIPC